LVEDYAGNNQVSVLTDSDLPTFNAPAPTARQGRLVMSWVDGGVPTLIKRFVGLEIDFLTAPVPAVNGVTNTQSVTAGFYVDNETTTLIPANIVGTTGNQVLALCPPGTLAYRQKWNIVFYAAGAPTVYNPVIATIAVKFNLGRIWTITASCRHNQQVRSGVGVMDDPQGLDGVTLLRNLEIGYVQGGYVTMWIPDAASTMLDSTGNPLYVSQVQCYIEDFQINVAAGVSPAFAVQGDNTKDMSYDVQLTLVEVL